MTQLEKMGTIVGLIVVGAGIYSNYLNFQNKVYSLQNEQQQIKTKIDKNEMKIAEVQSYNGSIDVKIRSTKDWVDHLQNVVETQTGKIDSLMITTHELLVKIADKKQ